MLGRKCLIVLWSIFQVITDNKKPACELNGDIHEERNMKDKMAAVVQIYATGYVGEEVKSILNPRIGDLSEWSGSGFFVQCPYGDDIIVTNAHVVRNARTIEIMTMLSSEETFEAELVGLVKNQDPDIAIIRLKKGELKRFKIMASGEIPYLELKKDKNIIRGTKLKAIGYPIGMTEPNITGGEITNFASGDRLRTARYVTNAAINPGNSGGPAIDENSEVIGINTAIVQDAENIGFITPSNFIEIILQNIFEYNSTCFSDIGGDFQKNSSEVSLHLGMPNANGVIVTSVESEGFLEDAGVQKGDVILDLNGQEIDRHGIFLKDSYHHRRNIFEEFKLIPMNSDVRVSVWRDREKIQLKGQAKAFREKRIRSRPVIEEREFLDVWGMTLQPLSYEILEAFSLIDLISFYQLLKNFDENKERIVITHLEKDGAAYAQEWSIGEVLKSVNGEDVVDLKHLVKILQNDVEVFRIESELGSVGFFKKKGAQEVIKLLNPSKFLK